MKKIAILIAHLGNGGAERVTVNLANGFGKMGHDVHMIVFHTVKPEYQVSDKVNMYYLEGINGKNSSTIKKILRLRGMLKEIAPDCVIELGFAIKYILMSGIQNKYNFIFSVRNDPKMWHKNSKSLFKYFRNYYFSKARYIVFQTEEARNYFKSDIRKKGVIIPNMIKEGLPEPYIGEREKTIVTFCRLNKQKNIPLLMDAFKIFSSKHPDYMLKIYGRGEEEKKLKEYAVQIGINDKVQFCGFCALIHNEILSAMMYVLSSDYEGISNSMLEALAIGLPSICTDCPPGGAHMFVKDGVNGFLTPVGNKKAMAQRMCELAENKALREQFSAESTKIKMELSLDSICSQWEELVLKI